MASIIEEKKIMEQAELKSTIDQIIAQVKAKPENKGKSQEEIEKIVLDGFLKSFDEGEITRDDLEGITLVMGYEFTPEFAQELDAKDKEGKDKKLPNKAELEDARELEPGESKEEFKEKIDDLKEAKGGEEIKSEVKSEEKEDEDEDEDDDLGEMSEEDERKKASELWKMDLNK